MVLIIISPPVSQATNKTMRCLMLNMGLVLRLNVFTPIRCLVILQVSFAVSEAQAEPASTLAKTRRLFQIHLKLFTLVHPKYNFRHRLPRVLAAFFTPGTLSRWPPTPSLVRRRANGVAILIHRALLSNGLVCLVRRVLGCTRAWLCDAHHWCRSCNDGGAAAVLNGNRYRRWFQALLLN